MSKYLKPPEKNNNYKLDDDGYVVVEFVDPKGNVLSLKNALSLIRISHSPKKISLFKTPQIFLIQDLNGGNLPRNLVCFADDIGWRKSMEDRAFIAQLGDEIWFYAVLDGHGGNRAVEYFTLHIPEAFLGVLRNISKFTKETVAEAAKLAFLEEDKRWFFHPNADKSGTTFTGALVTPYDIFTINLGDSRTLISQGDSLYTTVDQKPNDPKEKARIEKAGYFVKLEFGSRIYRVGGILAVARALGDNKFKTHESSPNVYWGEDASVSPVPVVKKYKRVGNETILIACDGIFDVINNDRAMEIYQKTKNYGPSNLIIQALQQGSRDNITVMAIRLP